MFFYPLLKSLLFYFDAELAHRITINLLKTYQIKNSIEHQPLKSNIFGLNFPNPVGLAAGFDKNSEVPKNIINLGFGFSEVGTVTPLPQKGNPKPRVFRLKNSQAIINRLGFNNDGFEIVKKRLSNLLSDNSKCNNLLVLKKSNKLKISMNTIKSRIADLSPNIEYLIKNLGLFEVSKPFFYGNVGFAYIICDTQNAENEENLKVKKNKMMNKHLLNLSNKILKRLIKQAQISQIQKIN